jgi:hypothetical protein
VCGFCADELFAFVQLDGSNPVTIASDAVKIFVSHIWKTISKWQAVFDGNRVRLIRWKLKITGLWCLKIGRCVNILETQEPMWRRFPIEILGVAIA